MWGKEIIDFLTKITCVKQIKTLIQCVHKTNIIVNKNIFGNKFCKNIRVCVLLLSLCKSSM